MQPANCTAYFPSPCCSAVPRLLRRQVVVVQRLMKWIGREVSVREAQSVLYLFAGKEDRYAVPRGMSVDDTDWIRRAAGPTLVRFGYATAEEMRVEKDKGHGRYGNGGLGHFLSSGLEHLRGGQQGRKKKA